MQKFRCKECGKVLPLTAEADHNPGVCSDCADWLETINANEGRRADINYFRNRYSGVVLDQLTLDWLRQNY
jgi:phage FluMu protein Com